MGTTAARRRTGRRGSCLPVVQQRCASGRERPLPPRRWWPAGAAGPLPDERYWPAGALPPPMGRRTYRPRRRRRVRTRQTPHRTQEATHPGGNLMAYTPGPPPPPPPPPLPQPLTSPSQSGSNRAGTVQRLAAQWQQRGRELPPPPPPAPPSRRWATHASHTCIPAPPRYNALGEMQPTTSTPRSTTAPTTTGDQNDTKETPPPHTTEKGEQTNHNDTPPPPAEPGEPRSTANSTDDLTADLQGKGNGGERGR